MATINIADKLIPNRPNSYSFLRIITGLIILIRGFNFIFVMANLRSMIQANVTVFAAQSSALALIIAIPDVACGLFIAVGFVTRTSAIIHIPVLCVATVLVNIKQIGNNALEFALSLNTFFLVIVMTYKGSGPF